MPKLKWKQDAKLSSLALGCSSDVERASVPGHVNVGDEIDITPAMLTALKKVHPPEFYTVLGGGKGSSGSNSANGKKGGKDDA